jgi:hypothetical protein
MGAPFLVLFLLGNNRGMGRPVAWVYCSGLCVNIVGPEIRRLIDEGASSTGLKRTIHKFKAFGPPELPGRRS